MLKKILSWAVCAVLVLACVHTGAAEGTNYGMMTIDGLTSDRVNLRAQASQSATSMGLFFTGTTVNVLSDPNQTWVRVYVGTQTGYVMSKYLTYGSVTSKQPAGTVHNVNSGYANMRYEPTEQAGLYAQLYNGESVTVLGETDSRWYLVDWAGAQGYIREDLLSLGTSSGGVSGKMMTINGLTSDRVNLRAQASQNAASMGLFFTGTMVNLLSDTSQTWTRVNIGTQTGYIMSKYLTRNVVTSRQPVGMVRNGKGSYANMRDEPTEQARLNAQVYNGEGVTVLGETDSHWYYVNWRGTLGYIRADLVALGGSSAPAGTQTINGGSSDRVHLRASPSRRGASMGLFFTGTTVNVVSGANQSWVKVSVGNQTGYIQSGYLTRNSVTSQQPIGTAHNAGGTYVNVRSDATEQSSQLMKLYNGETVTVLGETHSRWYLVERNGTQGYIREDLLTLGTSLGTNGKLNTGDAG